MNIYIYSEKTTDNGLKFRRYASDNNATYILKSARAHDLYKDYVNKYDRTPSSKWYRRHFNFERINLKLYE